MFERISGDFTDVDSDGITIDLPDIATDFLKNWKCVIDTIEACSDLSDPSKYIFDPNKIVVAGGVAKLKLLNDPGKTFDQNFLNDIGFVYDSLLSEFVAGKIQQKNQRLTDATFGTNYNTDINGNWGDGVLTGTPVGGAAISGGKLDLSHDDVRYVDYDAGLNADSQQAICVRFLYTPKYSGSPSADKTIFSIAKQTGQSNNLITLVHKTNGKFLILIHDQADAPIVNYETPIWNQTVDQEYEIELNIDITTGATRLFVDGTQLGVTQTGTGTRSVTISSLRVGGDNAGVDASDFLIDNFMIFSTIQHTTSYTPGYTVNDFDYLESKIELPQFVYPGALNLKAFTGLTTTETGSPREVWNNLYWNGSAWVASDGSYAQANSKADVIINIASFPVSDILDVDIIFPGSNSQNNIDDLSIEYTGDIYPIDDPMVSAICACILGGTLTGFSIVAILPAGSNIKFHMSADNSVTWKYWDGSEWVVTDGTYTQANAASEINENVPTLAGTKEYSCRALLHSDTGKETPALDKVIGTGTSEDDFEITGNTQIKIYFSNSLIGAGSFRANFINRNSLALFESDLSNINKIPDTLIDKKFITTDKFFTEKIKGQFRYLFKNFPDDTSPLDRIINLREVQTTFCYFLLSEIYSDLSIEEGDQNDYKGKSFMKKYRDLIQNSLALLSVDQDSNNELSNEEKSTAQNYGTILRR